MWFSVQGIEKYRVAYNFKCLNYYINEKGLRGGELNNTGDSGPKK